MHSSLKPLEGQTLAEKAYDALRAAILNMTLEPGQPLVEAKLAEALGISKTPIRQALHQLEQTGLVVGLPNRGYAVSQLSVLDAREILQLRAVLEGLAAREACERLTQDDFRQMEQLLNEANQARSNGEIELCAELGHKFHRIIHARAENRRLSLLIDLLDDQFHRIRLLSSRVPGRLPHSLEEHALLLNALQDREPERAEQLMRHHLLEVLADVERDESLISRSFSRTTSTNSGHHPQGWRP